MPNNIQIKYLPSYIPLLILACLTIVSVITVLFLHHYQYALLLLIALVALHYYQAHSHSAQALCYENRQWFLKIANRNEKVDAHFKLFICSYFLVVIFVTQDKKRWPCYFSRYNCSDSQYRFLCATLPL